jgi:aspartokinase
VFGALAESNISVDMIIQSATRPERGHRADVTFTVARPTSARQAPSSKQVAAKVGARREATTTTS